MKNNNQQQQNNFDTQSIKNALQHHFNLSKLFALIDSISSTFTDNEKPNFFEVSKSYIWLYVKGKDQNGYDTYEALQNKYNDCKGWAIPESCYEKNNKNILTELLKIAASSEDFKKCNKPQSGYFIKELPNNKPLTLLNAKNNNFVCFAIFGTYQKINCIDINENKNEYEKDFFGINNNYWDAKKIRKQAVNIYAIYNKKMPQYLELRAAINNKREKRAEDKKNNNKKLTRYFYNDTSFLHGLLYDGVSLYNSFSHNSLLRHEYDVCAPGLKVIYNNAKFLETSEPMTREEIFNFIVDRSGYCVLFYRYDLIERLKTLKYKREQERKEQERKEWITSDKADLLKAVAPYWYYLKEQIEKRIADLNKILNEKDFNELKKYRELLKDFNKLSDFSKYRSVSEWQKDFESVKNDFDFFNRAIIKGVFEKIACRHHYEKQQDGSYKNISKDTYFANPERYIQTF